MKRTTTTNNSVRKTCSAARMAVVGLMLVGAMLLHSCSTTKSVQGVTSATQLSTEDRYKQRVFNNACSAKALTAKMKLDLTMGGKDISLSGNLRMKRGDVIQMSLTFPIVGEVGRMEFTPDYVLIVDRINNRYVKAAYSKIDFLRSSNLDFSALESVFWNEVFYPGAKAADKAEEFTVSSAGSHTLLSLATAPKLDYAFLTLTESALLDRTTVTSKNLADKSALTCIYGDFVKFGKGKFPSTVKLSFSGDKQSCGLDMTLSSLTESADWNSRTKLSSKYKEMDAESLLKNLVP